MLERNFKKVGKTVLSKKNLPNVVEVDVELGSFENDLEHVIARVVSLSVISSADLFFPRKEF